MAKIDAFEDYKAKSNTSIYIYSKRDIDLFASRALLLPLAHPELLRFRRHPRTAHQLHRSSLSDLDTKGPRPIRDLCGVGVVAKHLI